ncbi:MAG: hypothetical protein KF752_14620 [Pirellulaceae bacterium]|nr:hypothetical protein [Pirellulaceae bacterium]
MNNDEDTFVFCYPVYFLLDPSPPVSFVSRPLLDGTGRFGIHVFTDEAAADQYLMEHALPPTVVKHAAANEPTFVGKLKILLEQKEFTHLIVDDRGGHRAKPMRCIPIKDIVKNLE